MQNYLVNSAIHSRITNVNLCLQSNKFIHLIYKNERFLITRQGLDASSVVFEKQPMNVPFLGNDQQLNQIEEQITTIQFKQIYGITTLSTKTFIILVTESHKVAQIKDKQIFKVEKVEFVEIGAAAQQQTLLSALKQSFALLSLFYSAYNLSQRLQFSYQVPSFFEHSFCCNYLYTLQYKNYPYELLTKFIFGFVETKERQSQGVIYRQTIISRGNYNHFGRRWLRRGLNSDGYTANHFETQYICEIRENNNLSIYSFLQLRGSIPLLWNQTPNFGLRPQTKISGNQQLTAFLFKLFVEKQEQLQAQVKLISLISQSGAQSKLGQLYVNHLERLNPQSTTLTCFDYNRQSEQLGKKAFQNLIQSIRGQIQRFRFFNIESQLDSYGDTVVCRQKGVFRTNCIDSVDRTNYVQMLLAKVFAVCAIQNYKGKQKRIVSPFDSLQGEGLEADFKSLWINNGNQISIQNSGSSIMKLDYYFEGSRTLSGILRDFFVGSKRHFIGHFLDYYYQNCLDLHFGKLKLKQENGQIQGNTLKKASLLASFIALFCLPYLSYKFIREQIKDQAHKQILSIAGSATLVSLYYLILRHSCRLVLQKPINSNQHQ